MAPVAPKKRDSSHSTTAKNEADIVTTPTNRSPIKRRKMGVGLHQKQALIENLQLEVTERARRLRSQYHLQAQGLRSRIEIRLNRIPTSLRKVKMEDLLLKYSERAQKPTTASRAPPVPTKDAAIRSPQKPTQAAARAQKRTSGYINGDKENEQVENPRKKTRGAQAAERAPVRPGQVLSPTSSNSRVNNGRPASPAKSQVARPGSPLKGASRSAAATNMLSNFVEKAKTTRAGGTRKVTTTSNTSSSSAGTAAPATTRRAAAPVSKPPTSRPATRTGRRVSANSETSEGSNATVAKKGTATKAAAPGTKKKLMGTFGKGTASGDAKKATAAKSTTASTTRTGRVLRNRR